MSTPREIRSVTSDRRGAIVVLVAGFMARSAHLEADHGSLIERDGDVAKREPGTHNGGGETTATAAFSAWRGRSPRVSVFVAGRSKVTIGTLAARA